MILTMDIGNTNVKYGVFDGDKMIASWRVSTKASRTADEYGMVLYDINGEKTINTVTRIVAARFVVCALCNLTLNTLALYSMGFITGDSFGVLLLARIITNLITFGLGSAMICAMLIPLKMAYNRIFRKQPKESV